MALADPAARKKYHHRYYQAHRPKWVYKPRSPRILACVVCGGPFTATNSRHILCSEKCSKERNRARLRRDYQANLDKWRARGAAWRAKNPIGVLANNLKRYGLTPATLQSLRTRQNGHCVFCSRTRLCVDHDHATGKVRGLLCYQHNQLMALFDADDALLEKMRAYREAASK